MDSPAWTLTAWLQLPKKGGANILRKSLGTSQAERDLSCWSWYVGMPGDRLDFGAHDFRGGSSTSEWQESAVANSSAASDGLLHNVALVVTPLNVTFYMDAIVQVCRFSCCCGVSTSDRMAGHAIAHAPAISPARSLARSRARTHAPTHANTRTHARMHACSLALTHTRTTGRCQDFASRNRLQWAETGIRRRKHPSVGGSDLLCTSNEPD